MYGPEAKDLLYYVTLYNENYPMPSLPEEPVERERIREGVLRGCYRYLPSPDPALKPATILFSGTSWQAAVEARDLLAADWGVGAECWSVTSYKALREDALDIERWNRLHPGSKHLLHHQWQHSNNKLDRLRRPNHRFVHANAAGDRFGQRLFVERRGHRRIYHQPGNAQFLHHWHSSRRSSRSNYRKHIHHQLDALGRIYWRD